MNLQSSELPCQGIERLLKLLRMNEPSLIRSLIGFIAGGLAASISSSLIYGLFFGFPSSPSPLNHNGEDSAPLGLLILFMLISGGIIGCKGFSMDFISDLFNAGVVTFLIAIFLCVISGLRFREIMAILGCVTTGIVTVAVVSVVVMRLFPPKIIGNNE